MDPTSSSNWDSMSLFKNSQLIDIMGLLLITLEIIAGLVPISFIIFTISKDFLKKNHLSTRNRILLVINACNMCYAILIYLRFTLKTLGPPQYLHLELALFALIQYSWAAYCWLNSCLSLFFFIKIVNFKSSCLSLMKTKIDIVMTWFILVVGVISLYSIVLAMIYYVSPVKPSTNSSIFSLNDKIDILFVGNRYFQVLYISLLVPYLTMIVTTTFTMVSLKLHICNLARSLGPSGNAQLSAHHGVVKTLTHLLMFYIMYFFAVTVFSFVDFPFGIMRLMMLSLFSPIHSGIIINGDPKLKEKWVKVYTEWRRTLHCRNN